MVKVVSSVNISESANIVDLVDEHQPAQSNVNTNISTSLLNHTLFIQQVGKLGITQPYMMLYLEFLIPSCCG